jgi:hypothetical protein
MATSQSAAAVELFSTSILSNHKIRSRHERYVSILAVKKIRYIYHDLAGDQEAKSRWRRKVSLLVSDMLVGFAFGSPSDMQPLL